ncbi:DUF1311 domain-containing protein [Comamonas terrigena]|uniref:lysozyme inhibitor LprI family protein n=1 Tax=Comamonas terrigena TaxID=32013 RepID=UPI002447D340|nr:DUF1311 domain-containing protein [Comamonas terrigena]MDH1291690.1 DUF1311 domain-containing protein [Comamonas terrigena]
MSSPAFPSAGQPLQSFASLCAACLLTVSALCPGTARAQAGAACDPQSTAVASLNACAVQHFQEVDTAQNILYADVMRALSAHERPALRQDQTAWSRQRTRDCKARHTADEDRADWPARYHRCLTAATEARHTALKHWLHHGERPPQ